MNQTIVEMIIRSLPSVEAIYLYGSVADGTGGPGSDLDIGVVLPHDEAKSAGSLVMSDLRYALESALGREVDLVNLRLTPVVFQKEVVATGRKLYEADPETTLEYEALVLSRYGRLNEERRWILDDFRDSTRAYRV